MNRRDFLKKSSLLASGLVLLANGDIYTRGSYAATPSLKNVSLSIITTAPEAAIKEIEQLIKSSSLKQHAIRYSEQRLSGLHVGDIVFVEDRKLLNFRKTTDDLSRCLREIGRGLNLPQTFENPFLLRFQSENQAAVPQNINISRGDILLEQLPIGGDLTSHRIEGSKGHVDIAVEDRSVRIVSATCAHKTCMGLGSINRPGQSLVCIPNQITVSIEGRNELGVDSISW